jgi:hypothetical protein
MVRLSHCLEDQEARRFSVAQDGQWSHIGPKSIFPEATGHNSTGQEDGGGEKLIGHKDGDEVAGQEDCCNKKLS